MTRRLIGLLATLVLAVIVVALAADSPAEHVRRIGVLSWGAPPSTAARERWQLLQGLRELGWIEGQNMAIEERYAEFRLDRVPDLVAELVRLKVDVIVAVSGPASRAAKQATSTIPIVVQVGNAIEQGLVTNLARPEGNITGVRMMTPDLSQKRLELLKEAVPELSRVAVLWCPEYAGNPALRNPLQAAAHALGVELQSLEARGPDDLEAGFKAAIRHSAQALVVFECTLFAPWRQRIVEFAAESRLPAMYGLRTFVEAGGLMAYAANWREAGWRLAAYVDKILKGTKPADLPIEQPTTFELVINLKTAQAQGLTIPPTLLFQATEVIR
jgi:putative ABC transport system substrate-binding protein